MEPLSLLQQLLFGVFLGGVIGLQREKMSQEKKSKNFAGIRTFALVGLVGVLLAIIEHISSAFFYIIGVSLMLLLVSSYVSSTFRSQNIGGTTEMALFTVVIAGYMVGIDQKILASMITIITLLLLHGKKALHYVAAKTTKKEISSISKFIIIWLIILPLLPNQNYGPYGAFNPYTIWLMVVLISSISFTAYFGVKFLGANRGISLAGFLGGLISSTATTLSFSKESKNYKKVVNPFVIGIMIAASAMFFRLLIEVSVVNPTLCYSLWIPLVAAGGTGVILSSILWYFTKHEKNKEIPETKQSSSPLELGTALKFGILFAVILLASKFMQAKYGNSGIYITSLISGIVDTDAITISLANLAKNGLAEKTAVIGITLAALSNTLVKIIFVSFLASRKVAVRTSVVLAAMIVAGASTLVLM